MLTNNNNTHVTSNMSNQLLERRFIKLWIKARFLNYYYYHHHLYYYYYYYHYLSFSRLLAMRTRTSVCLPKEEIKGCRGHQPIGADMGSLRAQVETLCASPFCCCQTRLDSCYHNNAGLTENTAWNTGINLIPDQQPCPLTGWLWQCCRRGPFEGFVHFGLYMGDSCGFDWVVQY